MEEMYDVRWPMYDVQRCLAIGHTPYYSWTYMKLRVAALALIGLSLTGCEWATFSGDATRKGNQLYAQGNYVDAAGSYQNAVRQLPTNYRAHYMLGMSYEQMGQTQKAIAAYKSGRDTRWETMAGIQDVKTADQVFDGLARTIAKTSDKDIEINLLKEHAAKARNGDDYIILARIFKNAGDPDNAVMAYNDAVTKYPKEKWYAEEYAKYLDSLGLASRATDVRTKAGI